MKTVMITSEVTPYSRTGILGDAVYGLSKGLSDNGVKVSVISPMYLSVCSGPHICTQGGEITVNAGGKDYTFYINKEAKDGIDYIFLYNEEMFSRRYIYGAGDFDFSDNDIRFGIFSLASLEYIRTMCDKPDLIHCHEWATGLVPVYRNLRYDDIDAKIVFTAHDITYQGIFGKYSLQGLGLPWSIYNIEELEYYEGISFLKGGMVHSDYITVPSPTYSQEIMNSEFSHGFGSLMSDLGSKTSGITDGIDYDVFDPEKSIHLAENYNADNAYKKTANKDKFLARCGLKNNELPLILVETKFSERKGLELIIESAQELSAMKANFVFLGYGESYLCSKFKEIGNNYDNMYTQIGISEEMVHLAYAAADFVLRPSQYEPCGNSHMKGMRYGAIPIVSKTGGHIDTVTDIEDDGFGFFMKEYSRQELQNQLLRALAFFEDKTILAECTKKVMQIDFSWKTASLQYLDLYRRLLGGSYES